ncbi:MAG: type IX secretion system membrane protein PorP/SprF [Saprospiraceae bacterium]
MKNILTTFILLAVAIFMLPLAVRAQQQPHNTQFMYYKLGYNPAFAGSQETACITCIYRQQWTGVDGAPSMAIATFNMPLANQRVGIGANLYRHTIGITTMYNFDGAYSYRVRLGNGMLGIGLQASIRSLENDFQKTTATQDKAEDASIPGTSQDKFLFNFGTGLYFNNDKVYFGLSVPRLLNNNIDYVNSDVEISREIQHVYLMGGVALPMGASLKLKPQVLFKYVPKAPIDLDANVSLIIVDKFTAGLTYRLGGDKTSSIGESIDILLAAQLTKNIMFGISYDYTLSKISNYTNGSIEASLHYCFGNSDPDKEYVNPRFF